MEMSERLTPTREELDLVFGSDSVGDTAEARARSSSRRFGRGQDHLGLYRDGMSARALSAWEAYRTFGFELLREAVIDEPAVITSDANEPARTLRHRRESLGLKVDELARYTDLSVDILERAENARRGSSIRDLEHIAQALGLDERLLALQPGAGGDERLGVRLRQLAGVDSSHLTPRAVVRFAECAWVIAAQTRLARLLGASSAALSRFTADERYGDWRRPAWEFGFDLARETRRILGIDASDPIPSIRDLCERELGVPLVQVDLPKSLAGATIDTVTKDGRARGIVVNIEGANQNEWVRRMTIAHELGHLLWDPEDKLHHLSVDVYDDIERDAENRHDSVEQRANAFAVEFLAPTAAVRQLFEGYRDRPEAGLRAVMTHFGISRKAARFHVENAYKRALQLQPVEPQVTAVPTDEWKARESYGLDWFKPESVPLQRRGRFASLVVAAEQTALLSEDTACSYLAVSAADYRAHWRTIQSLFGT
jgi:Zn-dependent peptidase ImmA (M78 family)/transcriptional regulator with XRE-family HTH domain